MVEPIFDHETLDVYQVSIEYLTASNGVAKSLTGVNRQLRDQWLEAAIALAVINAPRHNRRMIRSFGDRETERLFHRHAVKKIPLSVQPPTLRKLLVLDAAESLDDLRSPPGNHLEKLRGDRAGQYSMRINNQWRICFRWEDGDAHEVEVADYD